MDKRKQENERVRTAIENALLRLMRRKHFSDISVSEIIRESGVARTSYYRNYTSKEDIIEAYIEKVHAGARKGFALPPDTDEAAALQRRETLLASLRYYQRYAAEILLLYNTGFGSFLLEKLNEFSELELGDMPANSPQRYNLYLITGAAFNLMIQWIKSGMKEPPEEIVDVILHFTQRA